MDKKEESGFGFKDKAKALETLELLKKETSSYRGLTVRGLLGRAKRTLKLTKDGEKVKNISEAIRVFEDWVERNKKESNKAPSDAKEDGSSDTVPGLGFKDGEKAAETLKLLEGRDPDYQKLAVKGLVGRAKRVLTCTKDKEKIDNIKDAIRAFEKFLDEFEKSGASRRNMSYLPLSVIDDCEGLIERHGVSTPESEAFVRAYRSADGQYKKLRTVLDEKSDLTWDIVRNEQLRDIAKKLDDPDLFEDSGEPTKEHLQMIVWAYSPQEQRMKKLKLSTEKKRKHSSDSSSDESPSKKKK